MARIERKLAIRMAALAVFASALLGMGQGDFSRPLLILAAAVASVYFTDFKKLFWLNRTVANVAAVGAVALSLLDFAQFDRHQQLLAISNLLIYLQVVVLFQQKSVRIYWQLLMLGLLQVVVAAALNFSVLFGALLVVYLFLGLTTLSLFFVYREALRYLPEPAEDAKSASAAPPWTGTLGGAPEARVSTRGRGQMAALARRMGLLGISLRMGALTLLVTVLVFLCVPRFGDSAWRGAALQAGRTVGFSQEVELGALGAVAANPDLVMRLQLIDEQTGEPFQLRGEPLLRGAVATIYQDQQWRRAAPRYREEYEPLSPPPRGRPLVRQKITLEPLDEPVVFAIQPAYASGDHAVVRRAPDRSQLVRPDELQGSQISFELATTGVVNGAQRSFVPRAEPPGFRELARLKQTPKPKTPGGPDPLAGLREIARQQVERVGVPPDDHYLIAHTLQSFLRVGGKFRYSLEGQVRDPRLDAVEDFVCKHRVGHCEYFASALVLMLRSRGVPARLVLGFKGGEYNRIGEFYQIRQLHAHAWVEAYLAPDKMRGRRLASGGAPHGGWLLLDPTPGSEESLSSAASVLATAGQLFDYVEMLWVANVVGMTAEQQKRSIYQPLENSALGLLRKLSGPAGRAGSWKTMLIELGRTVWNWFRGNWFSWRGGLAAMAICLVLAALYRWVAVPALALLRRLTPARRGTAAPRVEFYRRLEALLARHGYRRLPGQTPREFATVTGGQLAESAALRAAAPLPRRLVEAFYRVRFGHRPLTSAETAEIGRTLDELEARLAGRAGDKR